MANSALLSFLVYAKLATTVHVEYKNPQYGFVLVHPPELVPEAQVDDPRGRHYRSQNHHFRLSAFGTASEKKDKFGSWKEYCESSYNNLLNEEAGSVQYQEKKDGCYLAGGNDHGQEFFVKIFYRGEALVPVSLAIFYPHNEKVQWDPWVALITKDFRVKTPLENQNTYKY